MLPHNYAVTIPKVTKCTFSQSVISAFKLFKYNKNIKNLYHLPLHTTLLDCCELPLQRDL